MPSIIEITVSIICNIIASFIFVPLVLKVWKPKIGIANKICTVNKLYKGQQIEEFHFKIVNKSIFTAFDLKVELFLIEPAPTAIGTINANIFPLD